VAEKEFIRLLICGHCNSVQELPWCGTDTNCNHRACKEPLEFRVAEHQFTDGRPHAPATLAGIDKTLWDDPQYRANLLADIPTITGWPGGGEGLGQTLYDVKATFEDDAFKCWQAHNRTTDCSDYHSESKALVPDTKAERKDLGLSRAPTTTYLCDYCPYKSIRQTKAYSERYKYNLPNNY